MPRIELKPLAEYQFATELTVRVTDLNYGGHLGNDRLLGLVHEARLAFLANHGWSEMDCGGVSLIMGDAAIVFLGQAYGGDRLRVEVSIGEPRRCGFRLFHRITRASDGKAIALVETGMICFDYERQRVQPLPPKVKELFSRLRSPL